MSKLKAVVEGDGVLRVSGLEAAGELNNWKPFSLARGRVFLSSNLDELSGKSFSGLSWVDRACFFNILSGFNKNKWTGRVRVETDLKVSKNLYFLSGQLVFAESSSMDDSLGEVLYRNHLITLEGLTALTTKVKKGSRLGEVLMAEKVMDYEQLWDALQLQVQHILNSIFIKDMVYFELYVDERSQTELCLTRDSIDLLLASYAWSEAFKSLENLMKKNERIFLDDSSSLKDKYAPGSFLGDVVFLKCMS